MDLEGFVRMTERMVRTTCDYCEHIGDLDTADIETLCLKTDYHETYQCTRQKGHEGEHLACGFAQHKIVRWDICGEENG